MKLSMAIILCSLSVSLSQSVLASSSTSTGENAAPGAAAGSPGHMHGGWCKEYPEKCEQMKQLHEERRKWREEKLEEMCKNHPDKCEQWKENHQRRQNLNQSRPVSDSGQFH